MEKIKDWSALRAMTKLIQSGNFGNSVEMNSQMKEKRVSLVLQSQNGRGSNNDSPIKAQCNNPPISQKLEIDQNLKLTPLKEPLENILAFLIFRKKITELSPPADPKGRNYDPSKRCAYHFRVSGHSTEKFWALKYKIQDLIDSEKIVIQQLD